jgi:hypothetical protein
MLSARLIHLIEAHQEEISTRVLHDIRRHPDLSHIRNLQDLELRERGRQILAHLGKWLAEAKEEELAREYEHIGKTRYEESIPLHESVRALYIIKDKMIDFVKDQGVKRDSMELYAEEELERRVDRFFDELVIHLVRGYEGAWRRAAHAAA